MTLDINNILKPKSEEEIISSMKNLNPNELLIKSSEKRFLLGVKKALELGANVHVYNNLSLRMASQNGYYDIVELLLKHDADVHAENNYALRYASVNGHYDVVKLLKKWS